MSSRGFKVATTVAGVAATAVLAGCASDAPQDTWKPAGPNAQKIQDLQWPIFLTAGIVGVIVMAFIAFCVVKYRDRGQAIPDQAHGKAWLEYLFIAIPAVILTAIAIPTVGVGMA
ncbi:MAG: cytochrome c oxidase subunit II transmembrane domain-containing protein [Acidimicrobiaceae bacterium]